MDNAADSFEFLAPGERASCERDAGTLVVRIPRGITRKRQLLATLSAALHFPDYFGHNWDALEECLNDLSWLRDVRSVLLLHADLPCSGNVKTLAVYLDILRKRARGETVGAKIQVRVCFPAAARGAVQAAFGCL